MVFKPSVVFSTPILRFENDVKMYGIQTYKRAIKCKVMFENDVKMYGIQTIMNAYVILGSLRMM